MQGFVGVVLWNQCMKFHYPIVGTGAESKAVDRIIALARSTVQKFSDTPVIIKQEVPNVSPTDLLILGPLSATFIELIKLDKKANAIILALAIRKIIGTSFFVITTKDDTEQGMHTEITRTIAGSVEEAEAQFQPYILMNDFRRLIE